jgi:hypothetical protein
MLRESPQAPPSLLSSAFLRAKRARERGGKTWRTLLLDDNGGDLSLLDNGGDLVAQELVDTEVEVAELGKVVLEETEVENVGDLDTGEVDSADEVVAAEPRQERQGLELEELVDAEVADAALVEEEGVLEVVEAKVLLLDEREEDVLVDEVQLGEVGEALVGERQVVEAIDVEGTAEVEADLVLVEDGAFLDLGRRSGGGGNGSESAGDDAGELHFGREWVWIGLKVIK